MITYSDISKDIKIKNYIKFTQHRNLNCIEYV